MARTIDSEAAYRFLSEQLVKETGAFSKGVNKGLNIARSAMRNPDAIPTLTPPNEWVSVEERLPEEKQRVIVRCERVGTSVGWILWGRWMTDIGPHAGDVTHWMPLPAPPGKDNNVPTKEQNEPLTQDSRLTPKMVTCPKGWQGVRNTRFYCPDCKKAVKKGEAYCHKCGQALIFPVQRYDKENNEIRLDFSDRRPPEGEENA